MNRNHVVGIGERIVGQREKISLEMNELFEEHHTMNYINLSKQEIHQYLMELLHIIGESLISDNQNKTLKNVHEWGKQFGKTAVNSGVSADEAMLFVPLLRKGIYEFIRTEFKEAKLTFDDYYFVADLVNPILDHTVYSFTQAYVEYNDDTFRKAKDELLELSVPVVPLTGEVAILPVIGTIDTHRSRELLDQSLSRGRELGLSYLIVDLSGVHIIDTATAQNLFQLNDALRVIGITSVFSGLRPELAQTIVNLGISFEHMKVVSNLEQALKLTGLHIGENNNTVI